MSSLIPINMSASVDMSQLFAIPPSDVQTFLMDAGWYSLHNNGVYGLYYQKEDIGPVLWMEAVAIETVRFLRIGK